MRKRYERETGDIGEMRERYTREKEMSETERDI